MKPFHSTRRTRSSNPLPFAALPHALVDDPRLKAIDLVVVLVLLRFARAADHAWPAVKTIALGVRRSRRTVQQSLRRLEAAGWLAAEPSDNRTGRVLVLLWRRGAAVDGRPAPVVAPPVATAVAPESETQTEGKVLAPARLSPGEPQTSGAAPAMVAVDDAQVEAWLVTIHARQVPGIVRKVALWGLEDCGRLPVGFSGQVPPRPAPVPPPAPVRPASPPARVPTVDLLRRLADPASPEDVEARVAELAGRLAGEWDQAGSFHGFKSKLKRAAAREIPLKAVVGAYNAARHSDKENKGAIFHWELNRRTASDGPLRC